jgi:hypothetical protein
MLLIGQKEMGGGFVRLSFTANGKRLTPGTRLTPEQIKSFGNHRRLIDAGFLSVFPPSGDEGVRHVVHVGGGRYDVLVGHKINDGPLTKEEAEELATRPS